MCRVWKVNVTANYLGVITIYTWPVANFAAIFANQSLARVNKLLLNSSPQFVFSAILFITEILRGNLWNSNTINCCSCCIALSRDILPSSRRTQLTNFRSIKLKEFSAQVPNSRGNACARFFWHGFFSSEHTMLACRETAQGTSANTRFLTDVMNLWMAATDHRLIFNNESVMRGKRMVLLCVKEMAGSLTVSL